MATESNEELQARAERASGNSGKDKRGEERASREDVRRDARNADNDRRTGTRK